MMHEDAQVPPADAGRLETPVSPDVWWWARDENGNIRIWTSAHAESLRLAEEVGYRLEPLYSQAALDAAVAAERERLAERIREEAKYWQAEGQKDTRDFEICALLIERYN